MQKYILPIKENFSSSLVVFLVALPLCLSIALACGAPLMSGLIAGIIGGVVVGSLSGSALGVSGPAAGLVVIIYTAIAQLGYETFLMAVVLAGMIQWLMGYFKAGIIGHFFPSSVIYGMLSGIGISIFIKQIPQALGYPASFINANNVGFVEQVLSRPADFIQDTHHMSVIGVTLISLMLLILWQSRLIQSRYALKAIPAPLLVVIVGMVLSNLLALSPRWSLNPAALVALPQHQSISAWLASFSLPDVHALMHYPVYSTAVVIAIVASLETLLSLDAVDQLDPKKRTSPANRELKAQGIGNIFSGCIGGLPVTQVIVRSSANVQSGGTGKASAVLHGVWLLLSALLIPFLLNHIPLATLSAILLIIAFKLANFGMFRTLYRAGWQQFLPFIVTVMGMLASDLLIGVCLGVVTSIFVVLVNHAKLSHHYHVHHTDGEPVFRIVLSEKISFLNKSALEHTFTRLPDGSKVIIDTTSNRFMDQDIKDSLQRFKARAATRSIDITLVTNDSDHNTALGHFTFSESTQP